MKIFFFRLWQWIWGFPQNLAGLLLMLYHKDKPRSTYRGCIVTHWGGTGSMSLGMFLFLGTGDGPALHTCNFDFDESVLVKGADFFEMLAVNFK